MPGAHAVQFRELELYVPALQRVQVLEPLAAEKVPFAQGRQTAAGIRNAPDAVLYVPAGHGWHAYRPYCPAEQFTGM